MPFPLKIQPIDFIQDETTFEPVKPVAKSRLKRLFERQFTNALRISTAEKTAGVEDVLCNKDFAGELEPSSVCLAKMVQNFIEESDEKQSTTARCGRNRCNCFNVNRSDSSEDEFDGYFGDSNFSSSSEAIEILKSLVPYASATERNLLAETAKIVEKNKISKRKDNFCRKIVADGLVALGFDASICKSRWEKSTSYPAGEYEYVDVIIDGERLIIDIDFRSEFEIARSTKAYKAILQILPHIFVGKSDRLQRIISIVSEAAKQSLRKKGMDFPPWRKADYVKAKWLSPHTRTNQTSILTQHSHVVSPESDPKFKERDVSSIKSRSSSEELEWEFGEKMSADENNDNVFSLSTSPAGDELPAIRLKSSVIGDKVISGLASVINFNP